MDKTFKLDNKTQKGIDNYGRFIWIILHYVFYWS